MEDANVDAMLEANERISALLRKTYGERFVDDFLIVISDYELDQKLHELAGKYGITPKSDLLPEELEEYVANSMSAEGERHYSLIDDEELVLDRFTSFTEELLSLLVESRIAVFWTAQFIEYLVLGHVRPLSKSNALFRVATDKIKGELSIKVARPISKKEFLAAADFAYDEWRKIHPTLRRRSRSYQAKYREIILYRAVNSEAKTANHFNLSADNIRKIVARTKRQRNDLLERSWRTGISLNDLKKMSLID